MSEERSTIEDLINNAMAGDYNAAGNVFNNLMASKTQDALDQEKIAVASQIFNQIEDDEEVEDDENLDDDEFDEYMEDELEDIDEE